MEDRVDESNSTDQIMHPYKPGFFPRLGSDEHPPNPAEVFLSKVNERVRNPRPGHKCWKGKSSEFAWPSHSFNLHELTEQVGVLW
jgi:hypothetical protein